MHTICLLFTVWRHSVSAPYLTKNRVQTQQVLNSWQMTPAALFDKKCMHWNECMFPVARNFWGMRAILKHQLSFLKNGILNLICFNIMPCTAVATTERIVEFSTLVKSRWSWQPALFPSCNQLHDRIKNGEWRGSFIACQQNGRKYTAFPPHNSELLMFHYPRLFNKWFSQVSWHENSDFFLSENEGLNPKEKKKKKLASIRAPPL